MNPYTIVAEECEQCKIPKENESTLIIKYFLSNYMTEKIFSIKNIQSLKMIFCKLMCQTYKKKKNANKLLSKSNWQKRNVHISIQHLIRSH